MELGLGECSVRWKWDLVNSLGPTFHLPLDHLELGLGELSVWWNWDLVSCLCDGGGTW